MRRDASERVVARRIALQYVHHSLIAANVETPALGVEEHVVGVAASGEGVAPLALLSPVTGVVASAVVLGERFTGMRDAGMALILAGLAVIVITTGGRLRPVGQTRSSPALLRGGQEVARQAGAMPEGRIIAWAEAALPT